MASIFPKVEVAIIRPLQAGTKQVPTMPVGIIGPVVKRITETKTNAYAIVPSTAPSVSMKLTNTTDSQYIDYDSVEVQLQVAGSDEIVVLTPEDKELTPAFEVLQTGLFIESATSGFYIPVDHPSTPTECLFFPTSREETTYSAHPGDWLHIQNTNTKILDKIKKSVPTKLTASNFPTASQWDSGTRKVSWAVGENNFFTVFANNTTLSPDRYYLVLVDKNDPSIIKQLKIETISNINAQAPFVVFNTIAGGMAAGCIDDYTNLFTDLNKWIYAIYDMPLGSLVTYGTTPRTTGDYVSAENSYRILSYNFRVSNQGASDGRYGRFTKTVGSEFIFMPDKRTLADYYGVQKGDFLRGTNVNTGAEIDFKIEDASSSLIRSISRLSNVAVKAASTANVADLEADLTSAIDGVTLVAGDLVLLKNQTSGVGNGIYRAITAGNEINLEQHEDYKNWSLNSLYPNLVVSVRSGSTNGGKSFRLSSPASLLDEFDINTTSIVFSPVSPNNANTYLYNIGSELTSTEATANKAFLVATNVADPELIRIYTITTINGSAITVSNLDFSSGNGAGDGTHNAIISDPTTFADWQFAVHRTPPNSLLLDTTDEDYINLVTATRLGSNLPDWDFSMVDKADYYMTGKDELTILNNIAAADGVEIGLADAIISYNVLETEFSDQLWDIVTQDDFRLVCGNVANYNPMGLASGLVEINTPFAYKVIPCNINLTERDPDNPKSYAGVYKIGIGNTNYHSVKNLDWASAFDVLNSVRDTQIPYYICPLSQDKSVTDLAVSTVTGLSIPKKMKEMITFITMPFSNKETIKTHINVLSSDFTVVNSKLRYTPTTEYVSITEPVSGINFLDLGIRKGDYVVGKGKNSNGEISLRFQIINIYPDYLDLGDTTYTSGSNLVAQLDTTKYITIERMYNTKSLLAENLAKKASSYGSFRVKLCWGDRCDITLNGTSFANIPSYYAAVAYAGMANLRGVVSPKTHWPINGVTKIYNVTPYFNDDDLETMGEGFMDILTQDYDDGAVYSKRQFMTDGSELSSVEVVDELAKYIRIMFRPYLGKYNISAPLFDVLGLVLTSIVQSYVPSKLNGISVLQPFTITGPNSDRLSLKLKPFTKRPFNGLDVEIEVS